MVYVTRTWNTHSKGKKDEICSELVKIGEDRKSEPPISPVTEIIDFRY